MRYSVAFFFIPNIAFSTSSEKQILFFLKILINRLIDWFVDSVDG
jgi:hypothetical protein